MIRKRRLQKILRPVPRNCPFCRQKQSPDFKEIGVLKNYLSERAKIVGKDRTGLCTKHQSALTREIKRARYLALLPFISRIR